ncbi:MAG TPA: acid phosphatase, partial [Firmicutes bacterium]|nr:acid phosphatase [Bacillota bacterium]HBT17264.1 acid phosphatase [Bacillota bacterium]
MGKFSDNIVFWSAFIAWIIAQFLKGIFAFYKYRKMDFRRFVGAGGMPSSHSAFVSALATGVGLNDGWASTTTALAIVFALVVMYDAAGVRLAASKQAATLNKIVDELFDEGEFHHEHLKELL